MTARTSPPPAVVAPLVSAELTALEHNLRRHRTACVVRWRAGLGSPITTDPTRMVRRAAERITAHEGGTP